MGRARVSRVNARRLSKASRTRSHMGQARHSQVTRCLSCFSSRNISRLSGTLGLNRRRRLFLYQLELEVCQTLPAKSVTVYSKRKLLVRLPCALESKNPDRFNRLYVVMC